MNLPFKVTETRGIAETFGEGIAVNLQFRYQLVLVGRDSREDSFREDISAVLFRFQINDGCRVTFRPPDEMDPRLVSMHRIQYDLPIEKEYY